MNSHSRRRVSRDNVYEELRGAVVQWELRPGERLSEEKLAERLGVSRTPVREALHRLESERLVVRSRGGWPSVADVSVSDAEQIFAVRTALETVAITTAALYMTDDVIAALDQALSAMAVAVTVGDTDVVVRYGREFHGMIHNASRNETCIAFLQQLQPHVDRYRTLTTQADVNRSSQALSDHRQILAALRDRDAEAAAACMARHTMAGRDVAIRAIEQSRSPDHDPQGQPDSGQ